MRAFLAILVLVLAACGSPGPAPSALEGARPNALVIDGADGRTYLGYPATVTIAKGSPVEIVFEGHAGSGDRYSALLEIDPSDLLAGTASVTLGGTATDPGTGLAGPLEGALDRPGQLQLRFLPDQHLEATIISDHPDVAGEVRGTYLVECLVPPEDLGRPAAGPGLLHADVDFRSAFCKSFATR